MARWDAVRVGLSLYGLVPDTLVPPASTAAAARRLRPVMALKARPVRVADLPAGHGVSYGPTFVTARPSRIATLPVGYADGWRRFLSDRSEGLVRGVRVPLVGRVAMDAVMLDVTDVPGPPVDEDDEFVLLGEQAGERITAFEVAATGGTISYEILAGMSRRLPRVYHAAGLPVEVRTLAGGRSRVARIELWNGDICDLEVDAIVSPASTSMWMSTGVAGELKRTGGDTIEYAALRLAPVDLGEAVVTPAGRLAARFVIHAVSLERDRRTSGPAIDRAARSAMARARELGIASVAFPGARDGDRRVPTRRCRGHRGRRRPRRAGHPVVDRARDLRPPRRRRLRGVRARAGRGRPGADAVAAHPGPVA